MPQIQPKTYIAYVRLTEKEHTRLTAITADRPGNQSEHIRQAVREYCDRNQPITQPAPTPEPTA